MIGYRQLTVTSLTSGFMQLARGFMQPQATAGRRLNILHIYCLFEGKNGISALEWG